jgi:threonyl-tRNA synthetase
MFVAQTVEGETLAVKPMNCPGHVQVFNVGQKSYRDLPLRLAEFGSCHRYEPSGALHGLMRVRQFVQDDAHIFCRPDQVNAETKAFVQLLRSVYDDIGMTLHAVKFSTRPTSGRAATRPGTWPRPRSPRRRRRPASRSTPIRARAPSTAPSWISA